MKIDKCPDCGETDCAWKWYADREKEFSGKLRDDSQDDFDDMDPVLKAEVINIYFEQAEQIQGLQESNAVLEKENKKWFAESEKAVGLHAENKRLKDKIQRIQSVAESNNDGVICGIIEERAKHE